MRGLLVSLSVLVALIGFGPLAVVGQEATPGPEASAPARTDTRYFLPFGPDGLNAALTVSSNERGTCTADSIATPDRPDAFDCIAESNQIYDPCFENPFAPFDEPGELACVADPFGREAVVIAVDDPLPREKEAPPDQDVIQPWELPWALELANGDRCTLLRGTLYVLAGETVYYGCEQNGAILGEVDRGQPVWTVQYLADGAVASGLVDVTVAWS